LGSDQIAKEETAMVGETKLNEFSSLCNDRLTSTPVHRGGRKGITPNVLSRLAGFAGRGEVEKRKLARGAGAGAVPR
jgi:hypothetical protein